MASTIDFASLEDQELLYGYQRINRSRFPENFSACTEELQRRGLSLPDRFEIEPLIDDAFSMAHKIGHSFSMVTSLLSRKSPSAQA